MDEITRCTNIQEHSRPTTWLHFNASEASWTIWRPPWPNMEPNWVYFRASWAILEPFEIYFDNKSYISHDADEIFALWNFLKHRAPNVSQHM